MALVNTSIQALLGRDEYIEVHRKQNRKDSQPHIQCIGRKSMYPSNKPEFDVSGTLLSLSSDSNATWLFWKLESLKDYKTNICILDPNDLTKAEIGKLARGYKILHKLGMVKRIKNKHYLINPTVIVTGTLYINEVILHWNRVCPEFKI